MLIAKRLIGFDTFRFIAALLVVLAHCTAHLSKYNGGYFPPLPFLYKSGAAVYFFFTLSGFLLTFLAFAEFQRTATINIKAFFIRRMRRILPLYWLCIGLGHSILWALESVGKRAVFSDYSSKDTILYHIFLLPNYITACYTNELGCFASLWSVGAEEQFYLFFPFLILFLLKQEYAVLKLWCITILYFVGLVFFYEFNFYKLNPQLIRFVGSFSFQFMLLGCTTALCLRMYGNYLAHLFRHRAWLILGISLNLFWLFCTNIPDDFSLISAFLSAFLLLIVSLQQQNMKEWTSIAYLGKISFGIYVYHAFVAGFLQILMIKYAFIQVFFIQMPFFYYFFVIIGSICTAHLSYQYFERRFL